MGIKVPERRAQRASTSDSKWWRRRVQRWLVRWHHKPPSRRRWAPRAVDSSCGPPVHSIMPGRGCRCRGRPQGTCIRRCWAARPSVYVCCLQFIPLRAQLGVECDARSDQRPGANCGSEIPPPVSDISTTPCGSFNSWNFAGPRTIHTRAITYSLYSLRPRKIDPPAPRVVLDIRPINGYCWCVLKGVLMFPLHPGSVRMLKGRNPWRKVAHACSMFWFIKPDTSGDVVLAPSRKLSTVPCK